MFESGDTVTSDLGEAKKPTQDRVRLAIVGLGLIGLRHADAIDHVGDAELCAVVDASQASQERATRRGVAWYDDLSHMIKEQSPDGIILATPTVLHVEQAQICIDAGIPVLVEKPLADDVRSAFDLVTKAESKNVAILVGHHRRHNPLIRKAHAMIQAGNIGDVRAVQSVCWFYKPDDYFEIAPWRKQPGAGPISVNLVHDIDLLRHLCGEITSVQAQAASSVRGYANEDVAAALLTFENGAIGTISVSDSIAAPWSWEHTTGENPIYPYTPQSAMQIGGSNGSLSIPDLALWTHKEKRDWWTPISATYVPRDISDPLVNQIGHFSAVIRREATPLVSGREGLLSMAVVSAIQHSAQTGNSVRMAEYLSLAQSQSIEEGKLSRLERELN